MLGNIVGLLAAALMGVCGVASANIIYNVHLSGGGDSITGTITTNGTLGALTAASIVAWNLSETAFGLHVVSPGNIECQTSPFGACGVTALSNGTLVETGVPPDFLAFYVGALNSVPNLGFFSDVAETTIDSMTFADIPTGQGAVLGTSASAPEPPTAILLGIGLACLGLACTRGRGRQSAAV